MGCLERGVLPINTHTMADTHYIERETRDDTSAAGWFIALIVILAVVIGAIVWYQRGAPGVPNTGPDVNITVPDVNVPGTGGTMQ